MLWGIKMKSWKKIVMASITGLALVAGLSGCGSGDKEASASSDKLLMYQIGQKPKGFDKLLDVANKKIKKEVGMELDIQFIDYGDYKKKMSVIVSSGESYDIAYADNFLVNAQKGAYADLTELMPEYAKESYESMDSAYIDGNKIDDKLYAFPVNGNVYSQQVVTFDKALLDKYNLSIDNVESYEDLEPLFEVIKKNETTLDCLATGPNYKVYENLDDVLETNLPFVVKTDGDTTKIYNKYELPEVQKDLQTMRDFYEKGYVAKDAATTTNTYSLGENTWFARVETQGPFDYGDTILTNAAGRILVSKPLTNKVKKVSNVRMANFVVSSTSKYQKEAIKALNIINSDPEVLNTFIYGIEGEGWSKTEDNKVTLLDGYTADNHLSAWNVGNNLTVYPTDNVTDEQIEERDQNIAEAEESPIVGCNFITDNVKTELTNISNVVSKYQIGLMTGTLDPTTTIPKMNEELEQAGMDKVMKELQSQYDAFLETK